MIADVALLLGRGRSGHSHDVCVQRFCGGENPNLMRPLILHLLVLASVVSSLRASDWPGWRGWGGVGVCDERGVPTEWSKDKSIAWKVGLPGKGASSPII